MFNDVLYTLDSYFFDPFLYRSWAQLSLNLSPFVKVSYLLLPPPPQHIGLWPANSEPVNKFLYFVYPKRLNTASAILYWVKRIQFTRWSFLFNIIIQICLYFPGVSLASCLPPRYARLLTVSLYACVVMSCYVSSVSLNNNESVASAMFGTPRQCNSALHSVKDDDDTITIIIVVVWA